jgi:integrase
MQTFPSLTQEIFQQMKSYPTYERYWKVYLDLRKSSNLPTTVAPTPREFGHFLHTVRLKENWSASTMWTVASCVNKRILHYFGVNLIKDDFVKTILKAWRKREAPKKAMHFTREQFFSFLERAPDTPASLQKKAMAIIAVFGGLRVSELTYLTDNSITEATRDLFRIYIDRSKTDQAGEGHSFVVARAPPGSSVCPHAVLVKYFEFTEDLYPDWGQGHKNRLWPHWRQNVQKFTKQALGKNMIAKLGEDMAVFLNLPEPHLYTSHCFRRTMANILANAGVSKVHLMHHGRWKSNAACDGYLATSDLSRANMAAAITTGNYDPHAHRSILPPPAPPAKRSMDPQDYLTQEDWPISLLVRESKKIKTSAEARPPKPEFSPAEVEAVPPPSFFPAGASFNNCTFVFKQAKF